MILVELTNPLPLSLTLPIAASGLYPQALIYDTANTLKSTEDLTEVGSTGRYTDTSYTPVIEEIYHAHFIVYTDAGHTTESVVYGRAEETYFVSTVVADITAILADTDAIDTRLPSDPADESSIQAAIAATESNIRGGDSDDLKDLSDQLDALFTTPGGEVSEVLALLENKLTIDEGASTLNQWNAAGDTIVKTWPITDKDDGSVVLVGTGPANRLTKTLG